MTDEVFIGLPTYGNENYTRMALQSIFDSGVRANIVLVTNEDGAVPLNVHLDIEDLKQTEEGKAVYSKFGNDCIIRLITHKTNRGLPAALNDIMDIAFRDNKAEQLIWMGNDVIAYPDAINALLEAAAFNPKFDYYGGREMAPRGFLLRYPQYRDRFDDSLRLKKFPFVDYIKHWGDMTKKQQGTDRSVRSRKPSFITGFHNFGLMRRSFFDKVGYVDSGYFPAYYSDLDYVRRGQLAGLRFCEANGAWYFHFKSRTAEEVHGEETHQRYFALNGAYYRAKWGGDPGREMHDTPFAGQATVNSHGRSHEDKLREYWQWTPALFANKHRGQICIIAANGPSLNDVDMKMLNGQIVFGLNRWHLKKGLRPTYVVATNDLLLDQFGAQMQVAGSPEAVFMPRRLDLWTSNTYGLILDGGPERFTPDVTQTIWGGHSVTFVALQIAYFMGFSKVVLVGLDHAYKVPKGTEADQEIVSKGDDPNHFSPVYFGKGIRWQAPNLTASAEAYKLSKSAFEADGRRIINASTKSALDVFERMTLGDALNA